MLRELSMLGHVGQPYNDEEFGYKHVFFPNCAAFRVICSENSESGQRILHSSKSEVSYCGGGSQTPITRVIDLEFPGFETTPDLRTNHGISGIYELPSTYPLID